MRFFALSKLLLVFSMAGLLSAQQPQNAPAPAGTSAVQGTVKDDTGGVIPGAAVSLSDASGNTQTATTRGDGSFSFRRIAAGTYTLSVKYSGLVQKTPVAIQVADGQTAQAGLVMTVAQQKQEVTVTETTNNQISTEASNNAAALVLRQEDLDALPDDPDDLQADLEALAGPSAGPGGNQIFIDGFTGGRLPPKSSIREIRINSNPFSSEFDKLGYGRIQIFTKPGTDRFHGQAYYHISDGIWNSRNPFLLEDPPFRTQMFGGNLSGPITQHASFFLDVERRQIDDNGVVVAKIPAADFSKIIDDQSFFPTPQRRTTFSPRVDWQLGANNTLSFRYTFLENDHILTGIGPFNLPPTTIGNVTLPGNGYSQDSNGQTAQIVETAVLSPHAVNETHFQFDHEYESEVSQSTAPELNVTNSFVTGGSGYSAANVPKSYDTTDGYEIQNYTSLTYGAHVIKAGIRVRASVVSDVSPMNFNGIYSFLGGTFPVLGPGFTPIAGDTAQLTSLQQFISTEQLLAAGYGSAKVTSLGYGPSKFTTAAGNPAISLSQVDFGPFVQDDWRVKPNFTLSLGVRWEAQTNISDQNDWAPRVAFAWSPDAKGHNGRAKTVIRGGYGFFYDRFPVTSVLTAYRYNGQNQLDYVLDNPTVYNSDFTITPPLSDLTRVVGANTEQRYQIDPNLHAPVLMQTAIGVERQLLSHTNLSLTFVNSRGVHELRTVDINAPLPTTGALPPGVPVTAGGSKPTTNSNNTGVRPYGDVGDIYDYQSTGIFKQTQFLATLNSQIGKRVTLFSRYTWSEAHSDTDGLTTMPADQYNFSDEWGPSALDVRNQVFIGGSLIGPWGVRLSPFFIAHSGIPFNIVTGTDLYLIGQVTPTARPEVVSGPGFDVVDTPLGYLNLLPPVGAPLIGRNAGRAPGYVGLNMRLSKTWGFGTTKFEGPSGGTRAGGGGGHGGGFGGFGGGGFHGPGGDSTEHRYNLTLSLAARNILNYVNYNTPNGVITSPYFLQSTGITGGYTAESTSSDNRRLDLSLQFAF